MNSPKYREFDKEKLTRNKKYEPIQVKPSSTTKKKNIYKYKYLFICLMSVVFIFWLILNSSVYDETSATVMKCTGKKCQADICEKMSNNIISGNICMDLCVTDSISIANCGEDKKSANPYYSFYSVKGYESTFICAAINKNLRLIKEDTEITQFHTILSKKIEERLHHPPYVEAVMHELMKTADVNQDQKISLAEANNLWLLLNNKHTFYMITLAGKSYVPEIKNFCGSFVEVEQIVNQIYLKKETYLESVLPISFNWFWPDWNYRCKISLGILEFFLDAVSFNPNDEFGSDSLYLCSSIETSFGVTFYNEAKITNYNQLLNGRELQQQLSDVYCYSDGDCVYTKMCQTRCNLKTNRCTSDMVKPQIVQYCMFLREYLLDNVNATTILKPLIQSCLDLKPFTNNNNVIYQKNEMPMSYSKHKIYIEQLNYWNSSMEYATITNKLRATLWDSIKFAKDPKKKKKKTTKPYITHSK